MQFTEEHNSLRKTVHDFVNQEMDPFIDEWEQDGIAPLHSLFKKMGNLGLLGIQKPEAYGGAGLDYSYNLVLFLWLSAFKPIWPPLPWRDLAVMN